VKNENSPLIRAASQKVFEELLNMSREELQTLLDSTPEGAVGRAIREGNEWCEEERRKNE
jgi:hypothetical protein